MTCSQANLRVASHVVRFGLPLNVTTAMAVATFWITRSGFPLVTVTGTVRHSAEETYLIAALAEVRIHCNGQLAPEIQLPRSCSRTTRSMTTSPMSATYLIAALPEVRIHHHDQLAYEIQLPHSCSRSLPHDNIDNATYLVAALAEVRIHRDGQLARHTHDQAWRVNSLDARHDGRLLHRLRQVRSSSC